MRREDTAEAGGLPCRRPFGPPRSPPDPLGVGAAPRRTCGGSGLGALRGERGRRKARPPGRVVSVLVTGSVAETPRLLEGAEPGLEYAPLDEDDGPVDCDCPAACYRGHRGYRSAPAAAGGGEGALGPPLLPHPSSPSLPGPSTGPAARRRPLPKRRRKRKAATGEAGESAARPEGAGGGWRGLEGQERCQSPECPPLRAGDPTPHLGAPRLAESLSLY